MSQLAARWDRLAQRLRLDAAPARAVFQTLSQLYAQPHRAYHNLDHINDCLRQLDASGAPQDLALELAIWYHDAIYEPLSPTNEQDSAALLQAHADSLGLDNALVDNARRLILITKHYDRAHAPDEQLLADIDRSVLARDPQGYDDYASAIRAEYASVDDQRYRKGRGEFLRSQLAQPRLFFTDWAARAGLERRARVNIQRELAALG